MRPPSSHWQILCGQQLPKWINRLASISSHIPFIEKAIPREWLTPLNDLNYHDLATAAAGGGATVASDTPVASPSMLHMHFSSAAVAAAAAASAAEQDDLMAEADGDSRKTPRADGRPVANSNSSACKTLPYTCVPHHFLKDSGVAECSQHHAARTTDCAKPGGIGSGTVSRTLDRRNCDQGVSERPVDGLLASSGAFSRE